MSTSLPLAGTRPSRHPLIALFALCALSWALLVYQVLAMAHMDRLPMLMPSSGVWGVGDWLLVFGMWAVMMVAMMLPSAWPMLLLYAGYQGRRGSAGWVGHFAAAYLSVWLGFSVAATLAQGALEQAAWLDAAQALTDRRLAGGLLVLAGLYQLTPLKAYCLRNCQSPLEYLQWHWRDGAAGAWRMGLGHGLFCLGCCWALMGLLFVLGAMSLPAMLLLTVFVVLEKLYARGPALSRASGVLLLIWGLWRIWG